MTLLLTVVGLEPSNRPLSALDSESRRAEYSWRPDFGSARSPLLAAATCRTGRQLRHHVERVSATGAKPFLPITIRPDHQCPKGAFALFSRYRPVAW